MKATPEVIDRIMAAEGATLIGRDATYTGNAFDLPKPRRFYRCLDGRIHVEHVR